MLSTRPQFHWTDQKLHVHAFMCVTAYLLVTLLHRRAAQKAAFEGSSCRLLEELAEVRCCRYRNDGPQGKATRTLANRRDGCNPEEISGSSGCHARYWVE
jgi:hypothetical protein